LQRAGAADAADEADPIKKKIKQYHSVPGVTEGNLRLRLAYGLLTPNYAELTAISDLRFGFCDFFGLMFKQDHGENSIRSGLLSLYAMALIA